MSADDANERIFVSRQMLGVYQVMMIGGRAPLADLPLIEAELQMLSDAASEHPALGETLIKLVTDWVKFREALKTKLH